MGKNRSIRFMAFFEKNIRIKMIQAVIISLPVGLFFFLFWQNVIPTGFFSLQHSVQESSPFIDHILPQTRASDPYKDREGDWVQTISGDPTYFFVHPHRHFETVEAEIWFKNEQVPLIELGALADPVGPGYDLHPLQNKMIDDSSWQRVESEEFVLLQRTPKYSSVQDFFEHPPAREEIATYHMTLPMPYRLEDYEPSLLQQTIEVSLRGSHEFYTYIKNEILFFDFFFDRNEKSVEIFVTNKQGQTVAHQTATDEEVSITVPGLPEGVYKVQMKASEETIFQKIITPQQKITFLHHLSFAPANAFSVFTETKSLRVVTDEAQAVQTLRVGEDALEISEPYISYPQTITKPGLVQIDLQKGDIQLDAIGHFAFSKEAWINPDPVRLWPGQNLDLLGVHYVIAKYVSPRKEGNWWVANVDFDASVFAQEKPGTWKFVFSAPEISDLHAFFDVGKINMIWKREPLTWASIIDEMLKKR